MDDRNAATGAAEDIGDEGLDDAGLGRNGDGTSSAAPAAATAPTADERDRAAQRRDELSKLRDEVARQRDLDAAATDAQDEVCDRHTLRVDEIRARARATRQRAAKDRERAALDRAAAAQDREQAARDRAEAACDREQAGTGELTGVRRRGAGLEELEIEMKGARREGTGLVVAYVNVDGLKAVNDNRGHAAGDEILRAVARELRLQMRSHDLLIRLGGDEFLCVLPKVGAGAARRRFGGLGDDLHASWGATVSIGYSEMSVDDSPGELVRRADHDLLRARRVATRDGLP